MATVRILLGIVCLIAFGRSNVPDGNMLSTKLIAIAKAELQVREATGNNDGKRVEEYLAAADLKKGQPWCAAFVSWVYKQAGYIGPRTGWSPALFPDSRLVKVAAPGNIFGIYFPSLKRIGHCGFVAEIKGDWISTVEGNTNVAGGREGDGVYRKLRHKRTVRCFSDWQKQGIKRKESAK